ncbi:MAG TPA: PBP1A family penicillin-binding protein [Candidatus Methanoperedens sp.]|nr:PBP1A family penicillin-binding protein [Candidatus Methanoperedens sp.]
MKTIINFFITIGRPILELFKLLANKIKTRRDDRLKDKRFKEKKKDKKSWFKFYLFNLELRVSKFKLWIKNVAKKISPKFKTKKSEKIKLVIPQKNKAKKIKKIYFGWKYPSLFLLTLLITGFMLWMYESVVKDLPNINEIYNPPKLSTKIYDRNGVLLYQFFENEDRSWVSLQQIPDELIKATLAIEDKEFYQHFGFSIKGIFKAIVYNFSKDGDQKPRGGSTITQQLVKNVFLTGEKSIERKVKEAMLAIMLEKKLNKSEILERYFNQVPYGGNVYGAAEAANRYFGKNVSDLSLAEAAFLAGLPAAPSSYSPYSKEGFALAKTRQEHVLDEMVSGGYINSQVANDAKLQKITILEEKRDILAPHFVFYVKSYLEKLGFSEVGRRGLKVRTSLDIKVQQESENIVKEEIDKAKRLKISNGASIVINVKTGDILAMVGSKDYFAKDIDGKFDVATQGLRQPGSSIKPINYLLALQRGKNLWENIDDNPVRYEIKGQKPYVPQNYTGKYLGTVSLKTALASSLNIPSVKLLNENGVENMIDLAGEMGISTWSDRSRFGLSLALGAGEVKMIEMAQAYSIFANLGDKITINPILEIDNYLGEKIYQKSIESKQVASQKDTFLINNALSDDQARSPIFGQNSLLHLKGKTVAVKTGTTNNLKDNWCIGWTPTYLVATWVGNNDSSPMSWVASGISGATPIWNRTMKSLIVNKDNENWSAPEGLYQSEVCGKIEWFFEGGEKRIRCLTPTISPTPNP